MALEAAAVSADSGALTIDQSIAAQLAGMEKEDDAVEQPVEAVPETDTEAAPEAVEDAPESETANEGEDTAQPEVQLAPIEPPSFWRPEARDRFRDVPRDLQEIIIQQESTRDAFLSTTTGQLNEKAKAAEAERTRLVQLNGQLENLVPQAERTFADKWANVDWVQLTDQLGAEAATKLKFQHDAEQQQLASLKQAQAQTAKVAFDEYVKGEAVKLPSLCPELVDAKEGPARRQSLVKYLSDAGIPAQAIQGVSAMELTIAWKAQQYDLAQAKAKALATAKPQPAKPAVAKPVPSKPGASVSSQSLQSAALTEAEKAFNAHPSIENSVKLQMAQERARRK
jgi:hypothetical protein